MISLVGLWFVTLLLIAVNFLWDFAFGYKNDLNLAQAWGMFNLALVCTMLAWTANTFKDEKSEKNTNKSS